MVALLVIFTILAFLAVDGIVLSIRKRREGVTSRTPSAELVFAQDGGKPMEENKNSEKKNQKASGK